MRKVRFVVNKKSILLGLAILMMAATPAVAAPYVTATGGRYGEDTVCLKPYVNLRTSPDFSDNIAAVLQGGCGLFIGNIDGYRNGFYRVYLQLSDGSDMRAWVHESVIDWPNWR